jgi:hypothetical protein
VSTRSRFVVLGLLAAFVLAGTAALVWRVGPDDTANRVALSADGAHWSARLDEAFFVSDSPWSPGQTRTAVFWVRNDADVRADVDLRVTSTDGQDLAHAGLLEISATVGGGDPQAFVAERDINTVRVGELAPGERVTVTLRAVLAGAVDVDSGSVRHAVSGSGLGVDEPRSALDDSGAHLELAPLFLGAALVVTVLVMRRTRAPRSSGRRRS